MVLCTKTLDLEIFTALLSGVGHRIILAGSHNKSDVGSKWKWINPHERPNFHLTFCYTKAKKEP